MTELPVYSPTLDADWIDYNGHLRDAYYGLIASHAVDGVMDHLGLDAAYREATRCTLFTLEMHLHYLHEVKYADRLEVTSRVLDFDAKRIQVGCMFHGSRVVGPLATVEMMLLHVRQDEKPVSTPLPDRVLTLLTTLAATPTARQAFAPASRKIELKRR